MDSADSGRSRMPVAGILSCYRSEWISVDLGQFALLVNPVAADDRSGSDRMGSPRRFSH